MHFRTKVRQQARSVFSSQKHTGEGSDAQFFNIFSEENCGFDFDPGIVPRCNDKLVCARGAWAVEQRVEPERDIGRSGFLNPELCKARELLAGRFGGVNGQPAGGSAVALM